MGRKRPMKKRNAEKVVTENVISFNGVMKCSKSKGRGFGGRRDLTVRFAKTSSARIKNAEMRIAQPNPTSLFKWLTMMGRITPPRLDPAAVIPKACPRFL